MKKAINLTGTIRLMEVGDSFWVSEVDFTYNSIRNVVSKVAREEGKKITTDRDKWRHRVLITRAN